MTAAFMVRQGNYKLVHYVGYPPQLFDLALDPYEERDLASRHETADIQGRLYDALHGIVDPDAANRLDSPISRPASNNSAAPRPSSPGPISTSLH